MSIHVILVEPEHPGNVGAAARSIKTMGLESLRLIRPAFSYPSAVAAKMAHNSVDVLDRALTFATLDEGLGDLAFSVATTGRVRDPGWPVLSPAEAAAELVARGEEHEVGLVLGRESSGLTNHEVARCSAVSTIPAACSVPAINLSHAVMVYAYEIFLATCSDFRIPYRWQLASVQQMEGFYDHLESALKSAGGRPAVSWPAFIDKFRRVFGRVPLESRDVGLLRKMLAILSSGPFDGRQDLDPEG
jgi:TrmH family RNA methyltransferase